MIAIYVPFLPIHEHCNYIFKNIIAENRTKIIQFKYLPPSIAHLCTQLSLYGLETYKYSFLNLTWNTIVCYCDLRIYVLVNII